MGLWILIMAILILILVIVSLLETILSTVKKIDCITLELFFEDDADNSGFHTYLRIIKLSEMCLVMSLSESCCSVAKWCLTSQPNARLPCLSSLHYLPEFFH